MFSTKFFTDNRKLFLSFGAGVIIGILALIGIMYPNQEAVFITPLRIIAGSLFILFLPGYFLTRAFFHESEIDLLERFALSFALSISVIPLLTFYVNLIGMKITAINVFLVAFSVMVLSVIFIIFFKAKKTCDPSQEIK